MKSYIPKLRGDTCKAGSGGNKYNVGGKRVDEVVLRFDEDEQKFYARIVNPSQHTQYLYEHGQLGITLCKLNTGRSQRTHMTDKRNWSVDPPVLSTRAIKFVSHPRWSRCGELIQPVTDLSTEQIIDMQDWDIRRFRPNQQHTVHAEQHVEWFTYVKALLVSAPYLNIWEPQFRAHTARGYKTYSNRIPIKYTDGHFVQRAVSQEPGLRKYRYDSLSVQQLDNTHYQITINNPNAALQYQLEQGWVYVSLEHNHLGRYITGATAHQHYGDLDYPYQYLDEEILKYIRYNSRWKFSLNKTITGSPYNAKVMNSNSIIYELPQRINCRRLARLEHLITKHRTDSMSLIVAAPSICISVGPFQDSSFGRIGRVSINRQYQGFIDCNRGLVGEITLI